MKCGLWAVFVFLTLSGCLKKQQNKAMDMINDLIKSREENRIIDHKRLLYSLDLNTYDEPYRTMLLMEKKYYFHDTTSFSPDHSYLQYMFDGIKLLERGDNKMALMKVDTFFQKFDTTQAIINAFLLPMVYENMATLRIKPEITKRLNNGSDYDKKDKIYHLSEAYARLLQQEILYNEVEYNKACALGQRSIAKLLASKEFPKLTAQIAYHTLKSKIECSDTIHLKKYYDLTQNIAASSRTKLLTYAHLQKSGPNPSYFEKKMNELNAKKAITEECELLNVLEATVDTIYWSGDESIIEMDFYELLNYSEDFQKIHKNTPIEKKIAILQQMINWHPGSDFTSDQKSKFFITLESVKNLEKLCQTGNPKACQLTLEEIEKLTNKVELFTVDEKLHIANAMSEIGIIELGTLIKQKSIFGKFDNNKVLNAFYRSKNRMMIQENIQEKEKDNTVIILKEKLADIDNKLFALSAEIYLTSTLHDKKWELMLQLEKKKRNVNTSMVKKNIDFDTIRKTVQQSNVQLIDLMTNDSSLFILHLSENTLGLIKIRVDSLDKLLFHQFSEAITNKLSSLDIIKKTGSVLYDKYFRSSIDNSIINIVFCPMGFTYNLPFGALIDQGQYLISKFNISIISNIGELKAWENEILPVQSISVFAFSDQQTLKSNLIRQIEELPNSKDEMKAIETMPIRYKKMLHGNNLTKQAIIPYLNADILHFATHAQSDVFNRNMNFLLMYKSKNSSHKLSKNEQNIDSLYGYQIENLPIKSKLIVLNACETNVGAEFTGHGVYSISTSFLKTDVKNLISTTHKIDDDQAVTFITKFYERLFVCNKVSQALKETQILSVNKHPYFWAGYQCFGNPANTYMFQ